MKDTRGLLNEILFWVSLFAAVTALTGIFAFSGNRSLLFTFIILLAVSTVFTVFFLKRLVKSGRSPLAALLKKLSARISKVASSVFKRISRRSERRTREKNYLGGRDYHSFGDGPGVAGKTRKSEKMRWSKLENGRDRVRFLYR
ncbi:MAG: hypothetical protein J5940_05820, partial [Clostridia bacterium]|nr:hypothetical protein [Clostridia bacterium]